MHTSFRFSPDILQRLGEELNQSLDQTILELVKNSFDANARQCTVTLVQTDLPGGTIKVSDDGDGMDDEGIINGWLILGRSGRSVTQRTRLNRVPAGSKGLGRLAALRLGSTAVLRSLPRERPGREYRLTINWADYSGANVVEEVPLVVEEVESTSASTQGTEVQIDNLHVAVNRTEVGRLARSLILLADPFGEDPEGFRPSLDAAEFSDLEKLVRGRYFNDAELHLSATVDMRGHARAEITDWKGKSLFAAKHDDISADQKHPVYGCPKASFHLWAFIPNKTTFSTRTSTLDEVKEWLNRTFAVEGVLGS